MITEKNNVFYCDCGFSFQRGRSGAHDCADGLRNKLVGAEARCAALAAELSAVETIHNDAVFITDEHYEQCPPEVQKMIRSLAVLQIPECRAFLAEVRAQGVEMFADDLLCPDLDSTIREFAAQLRKGVQS
ncbi:MULTISPECIES: hypothetical protein [Enterobacter]|uniref:hypothetical protein n=1 Tax=Enterobacter TaxID=547 RepID=UPI001BE00C4D|nr:MULTISPECIES: hypothetical protein [Enterobacter]MBT2063949.1 hypothetical protein [Enterobacter hormaechei subsp. xiangfangensis]MBY7208504.1 hypothetical protein [Enterobacter hormaechei]MCM7700298.1 hypothetical protein [Enterobacter hormaechei]MCM7705000.1 hypothetical protein [Enterobacter hormaechei]MCM7709570.1 hypothetical protein [Enterobacter hormaechei]